jgi:hypothetical protein
VGISQYAYFSNPGLFNVLSAHYIALLTISPAQGDIVGREYINYPGLQVSPPVHENQLSKSNKLDAEAIWLFNHLFSSAEDNNAMPE